MTKRSRRGVRLRQLLRLRAVHVVGMLAVLPLVAVDPAMIVLLYDAEFLAMMGAVGLAMLRGDGRLLWLRVRDSQIGTDLRVSTMITRESPRSLWSC